MDWKDIAPPRTSQGDSSLPYGYAEVGTAVLHMKRQLEFQVPGLFSFIRGAFCNTARCEEVCLRTRFHTRYGDCGTHYHVTFMVMVIPTGIVSEHVMISFHLPLEHSSEV